LSTVRANFTTGAQPALDPNLSAPHGNHELRLAQLARPVAGAAPDDPTGAPVVMPDRIPARSPLGKTSTVLTNTGYVLLSC
jgi:hypothetical protein